MTFRVPNVHLIGGSLIILGSLQSLPLSAQTIAVQGTKIDVDLYGNVYVLDGERNTLRLYDKSGTMIREVGGPGWLDGQFDRPAGLWARNGIDVFVADYGNHRIERFDRKLNFISSFSTRDSDNPDERFGYPTDVALSRQGELFICDTENGRIVKVDQTSKVERTFGGFGGGRGRLTAPRRLELGPKDAVYVLDGRRVAVFDAFGNYIRDLVPGVFTEPSAVFSDQTVVAVLDSQIVFFFDGEERPAGTLALQAILPANSDVRSFALGGVFLYFLTPEGVFRVADPRLRKSEGLN